MNKLVTAALLSVALMTTSTAAQAATPKPQAVAKSTIKKPTTTTAEGTATHEAVESKSSKMTEKATAKKAKLTKVKTLTPKATKSK